MTYFSKRLLWFFLITTLAGVGMHFAYTLLPCVLTSVFSPVNESIWEHLKILFWPFLAASLILVRLEGKLAGRMLSLLVISIIMLAGGYLYHVVLGGSSLAFDIIFYVLLMAGGFFLSEVFEQLLEGRWSELFLLLVIALGVAIILFTFLPPDYPLYTDFSSTNTWYTIPF